MNGRLTSHFPIRTMASTCRMAVGLIAMLTLAVGVQGQPAFALGAKALQTKALWHMDQKSGLVMTDSSGTHDGALTNIGLAAPGFLGKAYWFNGATSKVVVLDATGL